MNYYAIIKSGTTELLEVIRITDWQDYEWAYFNTLNDSETDEILLFSDKLSAIDFMLKNFNKELIDEKYFTNYSKDYKFYFR